jgi:hypothetical protein
MYSSIILNLDTRWRWVDGLVPEYAVMWPACEADQSSPSIVEVKKAWAYITPQYAFMSWCSINQAQEQLYLFSLLSSFWKNKRRLMKSPFCLSICMCIPLNILGSWCLWDHLAVCLRLPIDFYYEVYEITLLSVCLCIPNFFVFYVIDVSNESRQFSSSKHFWNLFTLGFRTQRKQ